MDVVLCLLGVMVCDMGQREAFYTPSVCLCFKDTICEVSAEVGGKEGGVYDKRACAKMKMKQVTQVASM